LYHVVLLNRAISRIYDTIITAPTASDFQFLKGVTGTPWPLKYAPVEASMVEVSKFINCMHSAEVDPRFFKWG